VVKVPARGRIPRSAACLPDAAPTGQTNRHDLDMAYGGYGPMVRNFASGKPGFATTIMMPSPSQALSRAFSTWFWCRSGLPNCSDGPVSSISILPHSISNCLSPTLYCCISH